jgi:type II secretory pathway component PulM
MGLQKNNTVTPIQKNSSPSIDPTELKDMIREALSEVLEESGLLIESTTNSKEMIQIKIGKHIFEGTIKKVKKTI